MEKITIVLYITRVLFTSIFEICKQVNRSEHGRGADEVIIILEDEGENCHVPNGFGCFLRCINHFFKKELTKEYFEFKHPFKEDQVLGPDVRYQSFATVVR